jgi:hypothetical protein
MTGAKQTRMSNPERQGRECPNCGRQTARGETQCERCGEVLAVGPLGSQSAAPLLWTGRIAAVIGLVAPVAALVAALCGLSLWLVHDRGRDAAETALAGLIFGAIGYVAADGFVFV